jgi:hypothetical protein
MLAVALVFGLVSRFVVDATHGIYKFGDLIALAALIPAVIVLCLVGKSFIGELLNG